MKKHCKTYIILASCLMFSAIKPAKSFITGFDPITPPASIVKYGSDVQNVVAAGKSLTEISLVSDAMSAFSSLTDISAGLTSGISPNSLKIETCDDVDIYNEDSVKVKLNKLFMEIPSMEALVEARYREKAAEFYEDSLLEIYTASLLLEKEINSTIEKEIEDIKKSVKEGGDGLQKPDDGYNSVALSQSRAIKTLDEVLRILQEAVALNVQLESAKILSQSVRPYYVLDKDIKSTYETNEKPEKSSSLLLKNNKIYASSSVRSSTHLHFAQMLSSQEKRDEIQDAIGEEAMQQETDAKAVLDMAEKQQVVASDFYSLGNSLKRDTSHGFVKNKAKILEIEKLTPISETVSVAQEAHNVLQSLSSYKDSADNVKRLEDFHKQTIKIVKATDECAIKYFGRYFKNPEVVWTGSSTGKSLIDYDLRGGISKEAYVNFVVAKAAEVDSDSGVNVEDFNMPSNASLDIDITKSKGLEDTADIEAALKSQSSPFTSPSKQDEYEDDSRKVDMLPWLVGANLAKNIATNPKEYGTINKAFPKWNDVKFFYNQYLNKKYKNIKLYVQNVDENNIKAQVFSSLNLASIVSTSMKTVLDEAIGLAKTSLTERLDAANVASEEKKKQAKASYDAAVKKIDLEIKKNNVLMDRAGNIVKQANDFLSFKEVELQEEVMDVVKNKIEERDIYEKTIIKTLVESKEEPQSIISGTVTAANEEGKVITIRTKVYDKDKMEGIEVKSLKQRDADYKKISTALESGVVDAGRIVKLVSSEDNKISKYQDLVKKLKEDKKVFVSNEGKAYQDIEDLKQKDITAAYNEFQQAKDKANNVFVDALDNNIEDYLSSDDALVSKVALLALVDDISSSITSAISAAYAVIDNTEASMLNMGDDLYDVKNHSTIVKMHEDMLSRIKAIKVIVSILEQDPVGVFAYENLNSIDSDVEKKDYFVGIEPVSRDLKAPKAVFAESLPNVREILHFDTVDMDNSLPLNLGVGLLDYGLEVPNVWKVLLSDKAFVETDVDFTPFFKNQTCNNQRYYQGGKLPCKLSAGLVLNINWEGGFFIRASKENLPTCSDYKKDAKGVVDIKSSEHIKLVPDTFIDKNKGIRPPLLCDDYSELGVILDKDAEGLVFSKAASTTALRLLELEKMATNNSSFSKEDEIDHKKLTTALLDKNQIGSFLKAAEQEERIRKSVEELKAKNAELVEELIELLSRFGFSASKDLDMANEDDYALIQRKLNKIKTDLVLEAEEEIEKLDMSNNDVIKERIDRLNNILNALKTDNEETVSITDAIVLDNRLAEEIKSAKANRSIVDKHDVLAKNALKDEENSLFSPYCAIY